MKKVNIINNLDEQIKSLNDNNIPQKYCTPSNNINIQNYLKENNVKYKHQSNAYLSLNDLLRFVDSLNPSENYSFNHGNETISSRPNKNEHIYNDQNLFQNTSNNNFLRNNPSEQTYYTKTIYDSNCNTYQEYNNRNNNSNYKNDIFYGENNKYNKQQNNSYICLDNDKPQILNETPGSRNTLSHQMDQECTLIDYKKPIVYNKKKNNDNNVLERLFECRDRMAQLDNIADPEKLITTKNLKLLLLYSPKSIDEMKKINLVGFGEYKINKYGLELLKILLSR